MNWYNFKNCETCTGASNKCKDCIIKENGTPSNWEPNRFYSVPTNADYIRNTTNNEMAEYLLYNIRCKSCDANSCDEEYCMHLIKEFLSHPYKAN